MSWIENQLREALKRREPDEGFAGRVMERIARENRRGAAPLVEVIPHRPSRIERAWFRFAAVAACVVLITGGLLAVRQQRRQAQEARERQQAEQIFAALQLTAGKLHSVRARIVNVGLVNEPGGRARGAEEE